MWLLFASYFLFTTCFRTLSSPFITAIWSACNLSANCIHASSACLARCWYWPNQSTSSSFFAAHFFRYTGHGCFLTLLDVEAEPSELQPSSLSAHASDGDAAEGAGEITTAQKSEWFITVVWERPVSFLLALVCFWWCVRPSEEEMITDGDIVGSAPTMSSTSWKYQILHFLSVIATSVVVVNSKMVGCQ